MGDGGFGEGNLRLGTVDVIWAECTAMYFGGSAV